MTDLLTEAFNKAQNLPEHIQNEFSQQLIEDIELKVSYRFLDCSNICKRESNSLGLT